MRNRQHCFPSLHLSIRERALLPAACEALSLSRDFLQDASTGRQEFLDWKLESQVSSRWPRKGTGFLFRDTASNLPQNPCLLWARPSFYFNLTSFSLFFITPPLPSSIPLSRGEAIRVISLWGSWCSEGRIAKGRIISELLWRMNFVLGNPWDSERLYRCEFRTRTSRNVLYGSLVKCTNR